MTPEEYEAHDNCTDSPEEYWQPEDDCHAEDWSYDSDWNTDDAPDALFMGNDLYLEANASEEYYTYNTDSSDYFSHSLYYTYSYDS